MEAIEKKASHTPGPWRVVRVFNSPLKDPHDGTEHLSHDIHSESGFYLADVHYLNDTRVEKVGFLRPLDRREMEANAKLIAAAPELLDTLRVIRDSFWSEGEPLQERIDYLKDLAAEAIKKATE